MSLEAFSILENIADIKSAVADFFGLDIHEPPLTPDELDKIRYDGEGNEVMTEAEARREYAEYLENQMMMLQNMIDDLLSAIQRGIDAGIIPNSPEIKHFIFELSHPVEIKDGVVIDEGGLRERIGTGLWILQHYDFETGKLTYYETDAASKEIVARISGMNPYQVLSEAYWPVSQRVAVATQIPEILREQPRVS